MDTGAVVSVGPDGYGTTVPCPRNAPLLRWASRRGNDPRRAQPMRGVGMRRNAILGVLVGALLLVLMSGVALAATERGTRGDDLLVGTERDDRLVGRNGDDRLKALEGNDTLRGGNGNDELVARD